MENREGISLQGKPVLIVDDDSMFIAMVRIFLRYLHQSDQITGVLNANDALAELTKTQFELVLIDYHLGDGFNGDALRSQMRQDDKLARIPCVLVTANPSTVAMRIANGLGFRATLSKPFNRVMFQQTIDSVFSKGK